MKKSVLTTLVFFIVANAFSQNKALSFDGSNDFVQTTFAGIAGNTAKTVEAWIQTTANADPNTGGVQKVICDWGSTAIGGRFTFNVLWNNAIRIEVGGSGLSGTIPLNDGFWHHVAAVYDPNATNKFSLYVDGGLDVAGNITTPVNTGIGVNFTIGRRMDAINYFDGSIDEVRVYNYARTATQINAELNAEYCSIPVGLVAYFRLNEGIPNGANSINTIAMDYAGTNNGSLSGFALNGTNSNWILGNSITPGSSSSSITVNTCPSFTSPSGNYTWTTSGQYTDTILNSNGCDSVIHINLTIGYSSSQTSISACDSFQAPNGQKLYVSASYNDTLTNSSGCDSIVIYNVIIHNSVVVNTSLTGCDSIYVNGSWYKSNQNLTTNGTSSFGCDSTTHLTLSISPHVDTAIAQSGITLYSNQSGATYQWIKCNPYTVISGSISQSFIPTSNGDYAVIVSKGACTDTSNCRTVIVSSVLDFDLSHLMNVIPNPNNGTFTVKLDNGLTAANYTVIDMTGKVIISKEILNSSEFFISEILPKGIYLLHLTSEQGIANMKFVVE